MKSDRSLLWAVSLLGASFILSLGLYLLLPGHWVRTVLQFPHEISRQLVPEARSLSFNWDREHNLELLTREILLGPARHDHLRLFARQAELKSVLWRNNIVYVDLKRESLVPDPDAVLSPSAALKVLKATLMANIPGISDVQISVEGEPPGGNYVDKG